MLPRFGLSTPTTFPFGNAGLHYFYLARTGIYALAQHWNLGGQEVLFPAYFHGVELEALLAAGVRPRFYPVHSGMEVRAEEIRTCISPKTRAIYLIHYLGFPGPVEQIAEVCRARGLLLIEDCALALLSYLGTRALGSFGDAAVFCLYKTLPVPNGGALLISGTSRNGSFKAGRPSVACTAACMGSTIWRDLKSASGGPLHKLLRKLRLSATSISRAAGFIPVGSDHFELSHVHIGMSRVCNMILAAQDFTGIVERRRRNYLHLLDRLKGVATAVFEELPPGVCPLFFPIVSRHKCATREHLFERGIETVNFWSQTHAQVPRGEFPEVDQLRETVVELPCHQDLTPEAIERLAGEVTQLRNEL